MNCWLSRKGRLAPFQVVEGNCLWLNRLSFSIGTVKGKRGERGAGRENLTLEGRRGNIGGLNQEDSFFYAQNSWKPEGTEGPKFDIESNCHSNGQEKRKAVEEINQTKCWFSSLSWFLMMVNNKLCLQRQFRQRQIIWWPIWYNQCIQDKVDRMLTNRNHLCSL